MSRQEPTTAQSARAHSWKADVVFKLFAEPVRQKLLLALARQPWQPPSKLKDIVERSLDGTMKRLASMRSEGFVVIKGDTVDVRRRLCALAPSVPLVTTEAGKVLDFGFLKVPLDASHQNGKGTTGSTRWEPEVIYAALADPARRRIIAALAGTPGQTGEQLQSKAGRKPCATLKHLLVLYTAGLLVKAINESDGRRPLHSLAPGVPLKQNDHGIALEFGFCTVCLA